MGTRRTRRGDTAPRPGTADQTEFAAAIDELPLWSAPFGLALLEAVPLDPEAAVLDVGCGTGFPLLELAHRLGPRARLLGVDPWAAVLARARAKCRAQDLGNVLLVRGVAEKLPIADVAVDLVVSNNGLNNVQDLRQALRECARVTRRGGRLAFTMNLPETMRGFYDVLEETLASHGLGALRPAVAAHVAARRPPVDDVEAAVSAAGFEIDGRRFDRFTLRFASAAALFSHWLIRIGFLEPWREIVPAAHREAVFAEVARRPDAAIRPAEGLRLAVPFACWAASRR